MITATQFENLKDRVEAFQRKAAESKGRLDEIRQRIKKEFECSTISEAKTLVSKMEKDLKTQSEDLEKEIEEFESDYAAQIG